jgi:helicase MOV-10
LKGLQALVREDENELSLSYGFASRSQCSSSNLFPGKSLCVCEAVVQVLRTAPKSKILVCAPSDAACDVLAARLLPLLRPQKSLLRINWWSRKVASVKPELLSSCPMDAATGTFSVPQTDELKAADVIVCQCIVVECLDLDRRTPRGWTSEHFTHLFIDETSQAMECEALVPMAKVRKNIHRY